jgi:hypothetical protein
MMTAVQVADFETERGISVRPDVLWIPVAAKVDEEAPVRAVAAIRAAVLAVEAALSALHPGARLSPGRLDFGGASTEKAARAPGLDVQLNGIAMLPLDAEVGLWARAELAARTVEVLGEAARALAKGKPPVKLHWRNPVARVAETEPHRAVLAARCNAHWRALTVEMSGVPAAGWEAPDEIVVVPVSLEEVRLVLLPPARPPQRR